VHVLLGRRLVTIATINSRATAQEVPDSKRGILFSFPQLSKERQLHLDTLRND
jgi:hypothetical protein